MTGKGKPDLMPVASRPSRRVAMPAALVSSEDIPDLAKKVDSPAMMKVLRHLQEQHFVHNAAGLDGETANALRRLAELGLADPGYAGDVKGEPFIWVRNGNGDRVLRYFEEHPRYEVRFTARAKTALASLPEAEREAVLTSVEALQLFAPEAWPAAEVLGTAANGRMVLLTVTPDLRATVGFVEPRKIEVLDLLREDTLRMFLERHRAGGNAG
jgi:hypothetical protein